MDVSCNCVGNDHGCQRAAIQFYEWYTSHNKCRQLLLCGRQTGIWKKWFMKIYIRHSNLSHSYWSSLESDHSAATERTSVSTLQMDGIMLVSGRSRAPVFQWVGNFSRDTVKRLLIALLNPQLFSSYLDRLSLLFIRLPLRYVHVLFVFVVYPSLK